MRAERVICFTSIHSTAPVSRRPLAKPSMRPHCARRAQPHAPLARAGPCTCRGNNAEVSSEKTRVASPFLFSSAPPLRRGCALPHLSLISSRTQHTHEIHVRFTSSPLTRPRVYPTLRRREASITCSQPTQHSKAVFRQPSETRTTREPAEAVRSAPAQAHPCGRRATRRPPRHLPQQRGQRASAAQGCQARPSCPSWPCAAA